MEFNDTVSNQNVIVYGGTLKLGSFTHENTKTTYGTFDSNTKVTIEDSATLDIGSNAVTAGDVEFKDNSTLKFTIAGKNVTEYGHITADTITIGTGTTLDLTLNGAVLDEGDSQEFEILKLTSGSISSEFATLIKNDARYAFETTTTAGTYNLKITETATAADVVAEAGGSANNAGTATAWDNVDMSTTSGTEKAVTDRLSDLSRSTNPADQQEYVKALTALAPEEAPKQQAVTSNTVGEVVDIVSSRMSGGNFAPDTGIVDPDYRLVSPDQSMPDPDQNLPETNLTGQSGGDRTIGNMTVWAQGLLNKGKLYSTNGFDSKTYGFATGFEINSTKDITAGVGYSYADTDVDSTNRNTDVDTHTLFAYGQKIYDKVYVNGVLSYGFGRYSEDKNVSGTIVKANYDSNALIGQVMTGYNMGLFIPETGLRYINTKTEQYTDSSNQTVSEQTTDTMTFVLGSKMTKTVLLENSMVFTPSFRIAGTYDLHTDDTVSVVTLSNGSSYLTNGESLDEFGLEFGLGLKLEVNPQSEISFEYEQKRRKEYIDQTGMLNFKYNF